jgi:hypothetical protein
MAVNHATQDFQSTFFHKKCSSLAVVVNFAHYVKMGRRKSSSDWLKPVSAGAILAPAPINAPPASQLPVTSPMPPAPPAPPAPSMYQPTMGGSMDPISSTLMWLNTNPYLIGMLMLLLNLGGRFLSLELTKKQEAFLQAPWIRPLIFFTVIFIATRNLIVAFWITLLFFFIIWVAANENSPFCMIPSWCGRDTKTPSEIYENNIAMLHKL